MLQAGLKVIGGKHHGKVISLSSNRFIIGREQDCHLRPNSELVSRHHCVFNLDEYALQLRDLGSTNGTFVNGERIKGRAKLKMGDRVHVGKLEFEVILKEVTEENEASLPVPNDQSALSWETEEFSASKTIFDLPAFNQPPGKADNAVFSGDTTVQSADNPPAEGSLDQSTPVPPTTVQDQTAVQPPAQPQGYPVPPQPAVPPQWPQQMPYQQPVYPGIPMMPGAYYPPNAYPQGMPGAFPPQAMPQPGMSAMPDVGVPPPAVPEEPNPDAMNQVEAPPISLPDPSETGVKEQPKLAESDEKVEPRPQGEDNTPSTNAAEIIKQYMQHRPDV